MDKSEPVPPVNDANAPAPKGIGGWVGANLLPLAFVGGAIALVVWKGLIVTDVALAILGLGLVIFIHELGHFVAAKLCDVHVETFSIGFGKAIPGCQFKRGETTYKIGWIPLGGYVKMVGEGDNADTEEAEEDPRSFKNKKVWQRMVIISAGVIMNLVLGCICFMVAYSHGVEETPAMVGSVGVGSAAWEDDLRAGHQIVQIDGYNKPTFDDVKPTVMSAPKGGSVLFVIRDASGYERDAHLVPRRAEDDLYPLIGINPIEQPTLPKTRRPGDRSVLRNSPADKSRAADDGSSFQGGDKIVATTDPADPVTIKDIPYDARNPEEKKRDMQEFQRRQFLLRGKPMTVRVDRGGTMHDFVLQPAYTNVLPGVRFQMGRIAAMRKNGPGAMANLVGPAGEPGLQTAKADKADSGDKIIAIEIKQGDETIRFVDELSPEKDKNVTEKLTDPLRLGYELEKWAETSQDRNVRLTVLRSAEGEKKVKRVTFDLKWDPALVINGEAVLGSSAPMPLSGLGLAYFVGTTIDSDAPAVGLERGDVITQVRFRNHNDKDELEEQKWAPLKQNQGASLHAMMQRMPSLEVDFKIERKGAEQELKVNYVPDDKTPWPAVERGFLFQYDTRVQKADSLFEALEMGLHRTWRTVRVIYQTLYATIFRQISAKTMSGPLSIANASYKIAGYDIWQFIIFIGLININLAIVNFLPIPVLDGGHMVFLIYEKVRGKPPPDKLIEWSLYVGLAMILSLMVFVIYLDVRRLWF